MRLHPSRLAALVLFVAVLAAPTALGQTRRIYRLQGDAPADEMGHSVAGAGDIDGDGYPDLFGGAKYNDASGLNAGMARLHSGRDGSVIWTFLGATPGGLLGFSVAGVGDVNLDGVPDLAAGAEQEHGPGFARGAVRVYSGATGALLYVFFGDSDSDVLGYSVGRAGDVNQDGWADVIGGAYGDDDKGQGCGSARVWSGRTGTVLYTFYGDTAGQVMGSSVAGGGDVDQDGYDDPIAGMQLASLNGNRSGSVRVFSGRTGAILYTFNGDTVDGELGVSVANAGDVDLDGHDDIIAGAYEDDAPGYIVGMARVYSGRDGSTLFTFRGDAIFDRFGRSVSGAGDVNQDGWPDVVVGAMDAEPPGQNQTGLLRAFSGRDGAVLFSAYGVQTSQLGYSAGYAGDVNLDGYADVLGGARSGGGTGSIDLYSGACGAVSTYGAGCPGSGGFTPVLEVVGCPTPGGEVTVTLSNALGGAVAVLFVGPAQVTLPLGGGCTLHVFPWYQVFGLSVSGSGAGNGSVAAAGRLPIDAPLAPIYLQMAVLDPAGPKGYTLSNGVEVDVD